MKLQVVMHNIRSAHNVGAILRTSDGFGVDKAIYSGYTPRFDDSRVLPHLRGKIDSSIAKTALGAEKTVLQAVSEDILADLARWREQGWQIVGLENNLQGREAVPLPDIHRCLGKKVVLVLGEEVGGIPEELYPCIDLFVEIPMHGAKESFNVSVATGVALYEITKKNASGSVQSRMRSL